MKNAKMCPECMEKLKEAQRFCAACGYHVELVPDEVVMERFLRRPSPGGLFWTQAYALGTRQYLWFILSLIPIVGVVALFAMFFYGRRWSWKVGEWENFEEYRRRQILMDRIGYGWLATLLIGYIVVRTVFDGGR